MLFAGVCVRFELSGMIVTLIQLQSFGERLVFSGGAAKMMAAVIGYHWAFMSTVIITGVALLLILRVRDQNN